MDSLGVSGRTPKSHCLGLSLIVRKLMMPQTMIMTQKVMRIAHERKFDDPLLCGEDSMFNHQFGGLSITLMV